MKKLFIAVVLACQIPAAANACRAVDAWKVTLLELLPAEAMNKEVVAKVKVVSYKKVDNHKAEWVTNTNLRTGEKTRKLSGELGAYVDAIVLEGIKGTKVGDSIVIFISPFDSCSYEPFPPEIGREAYVAGDIEDGVLEGQWQVWVPANKR